MNSITSLQTAQIRAAIVAAMDFIEEEAENRSAAGGSMSDYEDEPKAIYSALEACLEFVPDCCAACGACPGFIGAECTGDCGWEK